MHKLTTDKELLKQLAKWRNEAKGYTYIMSNPAWKGEYKIGRTKDPKTRLSVAMRWTPKKDFKFEHKVFTKDAKRLEYEMHKSLELHGVKKSGEWFPFDLKVLINLANKLAKNEPNWKETDFSSYVVPKDKLTKVYPLDLDEFQKRMSKYDAI